MFRRTVSAIMLTLILTSILPLAFHIQPVETELSTLTVPDKPATTQGTINLASQEPPPTEWNKTYGGTGDDYALSVVQTGDGGYAIAGYTESFGAGNRDFWLVKTDASGNMVWNKTYGGTSDDQAYSVVQAGDGGYALAGGTRSFGAGAYDFWLVKTDANGNMQWNKTYGGTSDDQAYSVVQAGDGGYALAGYTHSFGAGISDFWLVKTDASGNMLWNKTYGGTSYDFASSMVQTSDGGYALAGRTDSFGAGYCDFWLVKTDANGNMQWNKTYGGTSYDYAFSVVQAGDGGYALAGYTESFGAGYCDFWLVKTDANGNMQWDKAYGGPGYDVAFSVVQSGDGGYALAGQTYSFGAGISDFWLVKTDASGNMLWNKTYGGTSYDLAQSVVQTGDGGYALAGITNSFGAGSGDFWLVKIGSTSPPPIYSLTITASIGGTTSPALGTYQYERGRVVTVRAWQHRGYEFDHWELDTVNVGSSNPYSVTMNAAHTLRTVFKTSQRPIASFVYSPMPPYNPVIGEKITFDASQSMGVTLYTWDFNDGHTTSTADPKITHSYSTTGTYNVNLTATNSNGKSDITIKTVTVKKPPVVLVHGFQSNDDYDEEEIWAVMKDSLTSSGFTVYISHYAWGAVTSEPIRRYAESLKWDIDHIRLSENVDKVDIVAHSMGGLVARWYIEQGGGEESVRKLIMLETPNRGCLFPGFSGLLATAVPTCLIAGVDPQVKTWADRICSLVDKIPSWIVSDEKKAELKLLKYAAYVCSNLARAIEVTRWSSYTDILAGLPYVNPRIIQNVHYVNIRGWLCRIPKVRDVFTLDGVATEDFTGWVNWHGYLPQSDEVIQKVKFILGDDPESYYSEMQDVQNLEPQSTPSISGRIFQSEEKWHEIVISNTTMADFVLVWSQGILNLTLVSPNGTLINPSYTNPNITYYDDPQLAINGYAIKNPEAGIWNVSVLGANVSVQGEEYALLTYLDTNTTLSIELPKNLYEPNEALSMRANLTCCDQPTTGASINAVIQKPGGLTENTILYDDGLHGDNQANDGLYANTFTNTSLWGKYGITVVANGSVNNEQFAREAFATAWVEQYPDLSLSESDICFSKETATEGEIITINATVHNVGEADANNASILFYDGNPANGTLIGEYTMNVIAGETENATMQWNVTRGTHQIDALVSPYNEFLELNYTNNIASRAIGVTGHDIALLIITTSKTVVGQTYEMPIDVIFENQGDFQEDFNVTLLANTTITGELTVGNVPNGTWTILTFTWNTTGFAKGNYTMNAYAIPVLGEMDTADDNFTDGWVLVTIPGDVTGDFRVSMDDVVSILNAFGSTLGADGYYWHKPPGILDPFSPNLDIDGNGVVNMGDITTSLDHFGQHYS